jgi:putative endonuclease
MGADRVQQRLTLRSELGRRAEDLAAAHLERNGFTLLGRNVRHGRLELDLIARRGTLVVFCEVRSRSDDRFISPAHTITPAKQERLRSAARGWLRAEALRGVAVRFDVACIVFDGASPRLEYYERAFT